MHGLGWSDWKGGILYQWSHHRAQTCATIPPRIGEFAAWCRLCQTWGANNVSGMILQSEHDIILAKCGPAKGWYESNCSSKALSRYSATWWNMEIDYGIGTDCRISSQGSDQESFQCSSQFWYQTKEYNWKRNEPGTRCFYSLETLTFREIL